MVQCIPTYICGFQVGSILEREVETRQTLFYLVCILPVFQDMLFRCIGMHPQVVVNIHSYQLQDVIL